MGSNYKRFYRLGFDHVVVGCIKRMAALMGFTFHKKMYLHFTETKKGSIITR